MRVFIKPQGLLEDALDVLRRVTPLPFPVGAMVNQEAVILIDARDLERALMSLRQAGIEAVPEFTIKKPQSA
jgi:hypothetical protein